MRSQSQGFLAEYHFPGYHTVLDIFGALSNRQLDLSFKISENSNLHLL